MPEHADRALALQRAIVRVIRGAGPDRLRAIREQFGTSLDAAAARCVGQVALRQRIGGDTPHSPRSPPLPTAGARPCTCVLGNRRFGPSDRGEESYGITESGRAELVRWANEFRSWLTAELSDWNMDGDEQLGAELTELAPQTVDDEPALLAEVPPWLPPSRRPLVRSCSFAAVRSQRAEWFAGHRQWDCQCGVLDSRT